jgi:hypothetical protein
MYNYFPFTITGNFSGEYSHYSSTSFNIPSGNIAQPSDILKFNSGSDAWSQIPTSHTFLNGELTVSSLSGTDWTPSLKNEWFVAYLSYVNLNNYLAPSEITTLFNYVETLDIFQQLSSPSLSYVTKNNGTQGLIIDPLLINNEVSIGLNTYPFTAIMDYANTLPNNNILKNKILTYYKQQNYISNCCKVSYKGFTNIVWCFEGIEYPLYNISNIGLTPSLINGGGNMFSEVKLAGNNIQAHYIVKSNVDINDPTGGLCSGGNKPFCVGDYISIVDTTCWSSNSSTSGWSWLSSDYSQLTDLYVWGIADVSNPCTDFKNVELGDLFFPIRVILFCKILNF